MVWSLPNKGCVPSRHICDKRKDHGRDKNAKYGVVELEIQERSKDCWWNDVLAEVRRGMMTHDTHAFLHGHATTVPGSWIASLGHATCKNQLCQQWEHGSVFTMEDSCP